MSIAAILAGIYASSLLLQSSLERPIDVRIEAATAPEVCRYLSEASGIRFECDPYLQNDVLVVRSKARPTSTVMRDIAETMDWEWKATPDGFRLTPSPQFRDKAELETIRAQFQAGSRARIEAQHRLRSHDRGPLTDIERFLLQVMADMPDEDFAHLSDQPPIYSPSPTAWQKPLSAKARGRLATVVKSGALSMKGVAAITVKVTIGYGLDSRLQVFDRSGKLLRDELCPIGDEWWSHPSWQYPMWKPNPALRSLTAKPPVPPKGLNIASNAIAGEPWHAAGTYLCDLAEAGNVALVSPLYDYCHEHGFSSQGNVGETFEDFGGYFSGRAQLESGCVRIKPILWHLLRPFQIPRPLLQRAAAGYAKGRNLSLDELASLIGGLTEDQAASPLLWEVAGIKALGPAESSLVRCWAGLPGDIRGRLLSGSILDASEFPAKQRAQLFAWLRLSGVGYFEIGGCGNFPPGFRYEPEMQNPSRQNASPFVTQLLPNAAAQVQIRVEPISLSGLTVMRYYGEQDIGPGEVLSCLERPDRHDLRDAKTLTVRGVRIIATIGSRYCDSFAFAARELGPRVPLKLSAFSPDLRRRIKRVKASRSG